MNRNLYIHKLKQAAGCVFFTQRRDDTNNIDKIMIMRGFFMPEMTLLRSPYELGWV